MENSGGRATPWPRRRILAAALAALLVIASFSAGGVVSSFNNLHVGPNDYNIAAWEARNFPNKWLFLAHQMLHGKASAEEQERDLARFFELTRSIDSLEAQLNDQTQRGQTPDAALVDSLAQQRKERSSIEPQVQATIEGRVTQAARNKGLTRKLPLIGEMVWPPVDFEFADSPRTLATSPRDHIQLLDTNLLRADLNLQQVEAIEEETERERNVSAIAYPTSGIGAYPPIVEYSDDYASLLRLVSHEWTHNYLFFRPLGINYYKNADVRAINETVADLIGGELAAEVLRLWPAPETAAPPAAATPPANTQPHVDVGAVLRQLRSDVDALLAQGKVDEAEALMEQRRQELSAQGVTIRRLNQAYFAFVNLYAGDAGQAAATNPIGPKVDELRLRAGSLQRFAEIVGGVTSVEELDRALARLQ